MKPLAARRPTVHPAFGNGSFCETKPFQPCLNKLTAMAKSKKRRKVLVFSIIVVVLLGLTALGS